MKRWIQISAWFITIVLMLVALIVANRFNDALIISKPIINIDYQTQNRFIDDADVLAHIKATTISETDSLHQYHVDEIEEKLNKDHAIKDAQVYKTVGGQLIVNVKQRRPIARIVSEKGSYYMDESGRLMPLSTKYAARVLVVSGNIKEPFVKRYKFNYSNLKEGLKEKTILDEVYQMAAFIDSSEFWSAQIEQLVVNKESEFEIIPKVGNHKIVFGDITNYKGKFEKLMIFYKKGLNKTGWNEYSEISLQYKNQVVCKKIQH